MDNRHSESNLATIQDSETFHRPRRHAAPLEAKLGYYAVKHLGQRSLLPNMH